MLITNDGPLVAATDYFGSEHAALGLVYLSVNAGAFRALVPATAPQPDPAGAAYVIVTRGPWASRGGRDAVELVWEDGSASPYHLIVDGQQVDRMPLAADDGRADLRCVGYGPGLAVLWDLPARYRAAPRLPWLKPWGRR